MLKFPSFLIALAVVASPSFAEPLGLGRTALPEEIAAWDKDVSPDGTGLPVGSGDVLTGEEVFSEKCGSCHGDFAEGVDNWPKLAGGADTLNHDDPLKTVGSYWPYLSTTWDYVNRSMPFGDAQSLSPDEVYSIVAYIIYSNDLVDDDFVLSNETFADFELPNKDGFIIDDRLETEHTKWAGEPCMESCKADVKVTMRALVLDVTPEETAAAAALKNEETKTEEAPKVEETKVEEPVVEQVAITALDDELVAKGAKVFKKCKACHKVGEKAKNGTGPMLNGIYGAAGGQVEKFKYSKALKTAVENGLMWDDASLRAFLTKPKAFMKGTKMSFAGLKKDKDLDAIIEFLKANSQ
jgi:cytochrome c